MDAVSLILQDHEKVKNLFLDFDLAPLAQPEQRRAIAEEIVRELTLHERIEEEIFYPAFRAAMGHAGTAQVEHAKEEHALVDSLLDQLRRIDLGTPDFDAMIVVLKENVEHHIADEEARMLPLARERMAADLPGLAADMIEYKEALARELDAPPTGLQPPQREARF